MKSMDLLETIGSIRDKYILEAHNQKAVQKKRIPAKRVLLIAAIISLLLLLVGCAAVLFALQKISLGRVTIPQYRQSGWTMDIVSTNGYMDSVNYQATQEWLAFISSYDQDRSLEHQKDTDGYTAPEDYWIYNCYTQEMQDKVDEICETYSLQLVGPAYFTRKPEAVFSAVDIPSMIHKSSEDMFSLSGGTYYRSGSFNMVGMVDHCFEGRSTADSILFVYTCDKKSVFFPDYVILKDMESMDSWEYTAWDGTNLILAQNEEQGLIVASVGDFYISVTLSFSYSSPNGDVNIQNPCIREDFEWIADDFAYQIAPKEPKSDWLQNPNGLNAGVSSQMNTYADYFSNWMPGSVGSEVYSPDYQQKFVDLDEDGVDEMLIWNTRTGVVYEVVTWMDGELQCVYGGGTYAEDNHTVSLYLCEGNVLEKDCYDLQGKQLNEYYRLQDHQLVLVECIMESADGKFYRSESGGASSLMWEEIAEAEYNNFRAKYIRVGVPQSPSSETIADIQESEENILMQVLQNQALFYSVSGDESVTLSEYCDNESMRLGFEVSVIRYAFVDMDGDGIQEAVVDFRFGENSQVMCMVLKWDSNSEIVYGTEFYYRQMNQIKEDGSFAYSGGGDNDGWAKLRWDHNSWVTVTIDNSEHKADVQWYSYPLRDDS